MPSFAYYNDNEPFAVEWLRSLIAGGHLPQGEVDSRPIQEVAPEDLRGFTQCHFFAGIGGWAHALQLARWPEERQVWTGSCPCQPFSAAGKRGGATDPRHLWPAWFRLIHECRPPILFGEQVEAAIRHGWLDLVAGDLEGEGYAIGACVLGAHSVGAPHLRQRLWFVAESADAGLPRAGGDPQPEGAEQQPRHAGREEGTAPRLVADAERRAAERHGPELGSSAGGVQGTPPERERLRADAGDGESVGRVDNAAGTRCDATEQGSEGEARNQARVRGPECRCTTGELGDTDDARPQGHGRSLDQHDPSGREGAERCQRSVGFWDGAVWLPCRDGKARPVKPGIQPLAHGVPNRVGTLRGAGNAIVPQVAAAFVKAYLEA